jgi:hypothetical protein
MMSFGINDDWTFEFAMIDLFDCEVWAYDPTIMYKYPISNSVLLSLIHDSRGIPNQPAKMHFIRTGIAGDNRRNDYRTLETLMDAAKIDIVDVLKVDAEHWEWQMLQSTLEHHILRDRVRQITMEIHFYLGDHSADRCDRLNQGCMGRLIMFYTQMLQSLEEEGFIPIDWHMNPFSKHAIVGDQRQSQKFLCCYELAFINKNLFFDS